MRWPTVDALAKSLRETSARVDCRKVDDVPAVLRVYDAGSWAVKPTAEMEPPAAPVAVEVGFALPGAHNGTPRRFNAADLARDLIDEARDAYDAIGGSSDDEEDTDPAAVVFEDDDDEEDDPEDVDFDEEDDGDD